MDHNHIFAIARDQSLSVDARILSLIDLGLAELDLSIGILSNISQTMYLVKLSNVDNLVGQQFQLGNTYCDITVGLPSSNALAINHFSQSNYATHPAFRTFQLETYIGVTVKSRSKIYGTLNFTQREPRQKQFGYAEMGFIKALGMGVSLSLLASLAR